MSLLVIIIDLLSDMTTQSMWVVQYEYIIQGLESVRWRGKYFPEVNRQSAGLFDTQEYMVSLKLICPYHFVLVV